MQKLKTPARLIFGILWLVFGLNFFFHYLPMPPPNEAEGAFLGAMFATGYFFQVVKVLEILVGLLLVTNYFVPLSLVLIAPITVNIFLIHLFLDQSGLPVAILMVLLNAFLGLCYLENFKPMLKAKS
ncbi:MAG: hypothetical protein WA160_05075 [Pseudobdellovibrio sp.]